MGAPYLVLYMYRYLHATPPFFTFSGSGKRHTQREKERECESESILSLAVRLGLAYLTSCRAGRRSCQPNILRSITNHHQHPLNVAPVIFLYTASCIDSYQYRATVLPPLLTSFHVHRLARTRRLLRHLLEYFTTVAHTLPPSTQLQRPPLSSGVPATLSATQQAWSTSTTSMSKALKRRG